MKVEMRFLPSLWQDEFQLPRKCSRDYGCSYSLANDQVSGWLNVLSQILSCERYELPERFLRMAREVGTIAG